MDTYVDWTVLCILYIICGISRNPQDCPTGVGGQVGFHRTVPLVLHWTGRTDT